MKTHAGAGTFFLATKLSLVASVREALLRKQSFAKHPRCQAELGLPALPSRAW
jgi:hypothetical protein